MPDAHAAAVVAMADGVTKVWALHRHPNSAGGSELVRSEYEEVMRTALAALTSSEAVRAALVAEGMPAVPRDDVWPLVEASPGLTAYYRRRAEAVVDAILAALVPPGAT